MPHENHLRDCFVVSLLAMTLITSLTSLRAKRSNLSLNRKRIFENASSFHSSQWQLIILRHCEQSEAISFFNQKWVYDISPGESSPAFFRLVIPWSKIALSVCSWQWQLINYVIGLNPVFFKSERISVPCWEGQDFAMWQKH